MIAALLFLLLLALVFPGLVRLLLTIFFVFWAAVLIEAVIVADDVHTQNQLRDPGSRLSREHGSLPEGPR